MSLSKSTKSMIGLLSVRGNPPIPFISKARKLENSEENEDKTEFIRLEFLMDSNNSATKYARHFVIFKDGCAENWVKWLMAYRDIESLMDLSESADKGNKVRTLLKGQALSHFERKRLEAEDSELPDNDLLELFLEMLGWSTFPRPQFESRSITCKEACF